jgi:hypothetical protein
MKGKQLRAIQIGLIVTVFLLTSICSGSIATAQTVGAGDNVKIESLEIADKVFTAKETKAVVYKQLLPGGKVYVSGRAVSREGEITSVDVSRDNGKTWRNAALSKDGSFEYAFRPRAEAGSVVCIRAKDSKGFQNNVEATCKEITVSEKNIHTLVRETLDDAIEAYENHNSRLFMSFFSDDFFGDKDILDTAIRRATSQYHDVDIRFTLNSVVPDYTDKVFASVTFNRRFTEVKTGKTLTDGGTTAFVLKFEHGQLKILSMTRPLMFFQ